MEAPKIPGDFFLEPLLVLNDLCIENATSFKSALVNVSTYGKEKITFNPDRGGIVFFCHDCKKFVETNRSDPKKMKFTCKLCKGKKISYGTQESMKEFYRFEKR